MLSLFLVLSIFIGWFGLQNCSPYLTQPVLTASVILSYHCQPEPSSPDSLYVIGSGVEVSTHLAPTKLLWTLYFSTASFL